MERKQAFLNAAIFAGEEALRNLGGETLSSSDKLQQMSTQLIELRQEIGEELLPAILNITQSTKDWIIFLDDDDMFKDSNCLKCISENIKSDNDIVFCGNIHHQYWMHRCTYVFRAFSR